MSARIALALLLASAPAAAGDYRLQQGDVLELVVVAPPLREAARIDIDGNVTLPIIGAMPAEGRRLEEVATDARDRLAAASLPPMAPGDTLPAQIWPSAVSLSLREYRPIYVGGAVRNGGAFPFSPGLTARRAIVLAGGAGRMGDAELQRLELAGTLAQLRARRVATAARLDRLRLEFAGGEGPLPEAERSILALRRTQDATADRHFDTAIRHTRAQIEELTAQLANETEGMAADRDDFQRIEDMRSAGTATALRLSDARRALLFSTTRQLQTATELARTTRELGSVQYEALRRSMDLRLEALTEARDATQLLADLDAQIAAAESRMAYLGADLAAATISITGSDGATFDLPPDADPPLNPGDLVTVRLDPAVALD
jgi:polysaccharide export outer membrane protein